MPQLSAAELADWSGGTWVHSAPHVVNGVSNDTRTLTRGNLYFALKGEHFDGHEFVAEAFRRGASCAVISGASRDADGSAGPVLCVSDTTAALRDIAGGYRMKVSPEIVAVTGSAGKSTVKELSAAMLASATPTASTCGNWNNAIGLPLSLLSMEETTRVGVFEIGTSHPGEINGLCSILKPSWGVVTNVAPAHLEFFSSVEAIAKEKACLLEALPEDGVAVLNREGGFYNLLSGAAPSKAITVAIAGDADYVCCGRDPVKREAVVRETSSGDTCVLRMNLPGRYAVVNTMLAVAVARGHGVGWRGIQKVTEGFVSLPMRWEQKLINGVRVINDAYNANPLSVRASMDAFSEEPVDGKKWLLLSGMLELGEDEKRQHVALGRAVGQREWDGVIVVGQLGSLIARGAEESGFATCRIFQCAGKVDAAAVVTDHLRPGDAVLLKASRGMHLEEIVTRLEEQK